jgi:hypothetical protein
VHLAERRLLRAGPGAKGTFAAGSRARPFLAAMKTFIKLAILAILTLIASVVYRLAKLLEEWDRLRNIPAPEFKVRKV